MKTIYRSIPVTKHNIFHSQILRFPLALFPGPTQLSNMYIHAQAHAWMGTCSPTQENMHVNHDTCFLCMYTYTYTLPTQHTCMHTHPPTHSNTYTWDVDTNTQHMMIICTHTFTDTCNVCTHTEWGKPRPRVHVESQPDHDWLCEWQGEDRVSGSDNLKENVLESSDNLKENVLESNYTLCTRMWCAESLVSFPHHLLSHEVTLEWDCCCPFTCMLSLVPRLSWNANMYRVESLVSFPT